MSDRQPKKGETVILCPHVTPVIIMIDGKAHYEVMMKEKFLEGAWWRESGNPAKPVVTVETPTGELVADWFCCCDECNKDEGRYRGLSGSGPMTLPADVDLCRP